MSTHGQYIGGDGNKSQHTLIVEKILGRPLPAGVEIHHVDGNGLNNAHSNLVVCPDRVYHFLLHRRARALKACGNANWHKCLFCKAWDAPENLNKRKGFNCWYHRACSARDYHITKHRYKRDSSHRSGSRRTE